MKYFCFFFFCLNSIFVQAQLYFEDELQDWASQPIFYLDVLEKYFDKNVYAVDKAQIYRIRAAHIKELGINTSGKADEVEMFKWGTDSSQVGNDKISYDSLGRVKTVSTYNNSQLLLKRTNYSYNPKNGQIDNKITLTFEYDVVHLFEGEPISTSDYPIALENVNKKICTYEYQNGYYLIKSEQTRIAVYTYYYDSPTDKFIPLVGEMNFEDYLQASKIYQRSYNTDSIRLNAQNLIAEVWSNVSGKKFDSTVFFSYNTDNQLILIKKTNDKNEPIATEVITYKGKKIAKITLRWSGNVVLERNFFYQKYGIRKTISTRFDQKSQPVLTNTIDYFYSKNGLLQHTQNTALSLNTQPKSPKVRTGTYYFYSF